MSITITNETLVRLRTLRLWHWREALSYRRQAEAADKRTGVGDKRYAGQMRAIATVKNLQADTHIFAVQTLNDFFAPGDTAERDDEADSNPPAAAPVPFYTKPIDPTRRASPLVPTITRNFIGLKDEQS